MVLFFVKILWICLYRIDKNSYVGDRNEDDKRCSMVKFEDCLLVLNDDFDLLGNVFSWLEIIIVNSCLEYGDV